MNDPNYRPSSQGGYNNPYDSGYHNDDYYRQRDWDRQRHEEREIEKDRRRLDNERRQLDDERRQHEAQVNRPPPPQQEHCPSGFSPSENKCSVEERRRGCKDMRLPGGLGCVHR